MSSIPPELALALRLRALSTVLTGHAVAKVPQNAPSLGARLELFLTEYAAVIAPHENVKRFIANFDKNAPLLTLPIASVSDSTREDLTWLEKAIIALENEQEIIQVERDLREIEILEQRGVADAGSLDGYISLQPLLKDIQTPINDLTLQLDALESQTSSLLASYNDHVNKVSQTFITLNANLTSLEQIVDKLEKGN